MSESEELNIRQKAFCEYYLFGGEHNGKKFYIANATVSYAKAYEKDLSDKDQYNSCSVEGFNLLRNNKIKPFMREHLESSGYNDEAIDARLIQIVFKGKDVDSVSAMREYNKLKQRITDKVDITSKGEKVSFRTE